MLARLLICRLEATRASRASWASPSAASSLTSSKLRSQVDKITCEWQNVIEKNLQAGGHGRLLRLPQRRQQLHQIW